MKLRHFNVKQKGFTTMSSFGIPLTDDYAKVLYEVCDVESKLKTGAKSYEIWLEGYRADSVLKHGVILSTMQKAPDWLIDLIKTAKEAGLHCISVTTM